MVPGTPTADSTLVGRCNGCGQVRSNKNLSLVLVQRNPVTEPEFVLVCGPCFVDGEAA